jgi:hypothetical protein
MVTLLIVDPAGMSPNLPAPSNPPISMYAFADRAELVHVAAVLSVDDDPAYEPSTALDVFAHVVPLVASTADPRTSLAGI